jgi:alpha-glucoside transport system permease protein
VERVFSLAVAVVAVPLALVGYVVAAELVIGAAPRRWRPRLRPWFWIAPAILFVVGFLVYPMIDTVLLSFKDARGQNFVGLANYASILSDSNVHVALRNNLLWVVFFTGFVLVFGLLFAVLADRVPYESAAKSLIFLPMAISFVAAAVIWKFMYDYQPPESPQTGTVNAVLTTLTPMEPKAWLIDTATNNFALILVAVWPWTGFAMVVLSAALKGIPIELLEASRVDGANELTVFRRIILPLLAPTMTVVATTMVIFALKAFDVVYAMTNGNLDTEVIANRMYKELFNARNFGRASAIAVLLLAAIVPVLIFNVRRFRTQEAMR